MNQSFGLVIEGLVSLLLLLTIIYCVSLNRQLKRLKADETSLKATITELVGTTSAAERAIAGLRSTLNDCEQGLDLRLRNAERLAGQIDRQLETGEELFSRLSRIALAGKPADNQTPPLADPKAMVAAAQALAERARMLISRAA